MALDINTGPERVEVTPTPTGVITIPGVPTNVAAFIVRTTKADAPTDTPVEVQSLDEAVELFGGEDELGNAYFALRGFYSNAGDGNLAIIVNVAPTASGSQVFDRGVAEAAGAGFVEDEGEIVTALAVSGYATATGVLSLSGSPDLSEVQVGDYFKDDNGRLFLISAVDDGADTLTIAAGLNSNASNPVHSAGGLNVNSTAGKVLRLYEEDEHNGRALVQEGASRGAVTVTGASNLLVDASAGGFLNIGTKVGDILVDSASEVFYVTAVIDDDRIQVDRTGAAAGAATVFAADVNQITDTQRAAGGNASVSPQNVAAFESAGAGFGVLPTSVTPYPEESLKDHFMLIAGEEKEILNNAIIASGTLNAAFGTSANTVTYTAATGEVQFGGAEDLSTAAAGDVWRDAGGSDFVIDQVDDAGDRIFIALNQTVNTAVGSTIRDGQSRLTFKDTAFNPGTVDVPTFFEPASRLDIASTATGLADDYFVADAAVQDSDYLGDAANGKGLHALDRTDDVNLIMIPGVTARTVQNGLIDYTETERDDAVSLLMIPQNIRKASVDTVKVNVVISTVANGTINSTVTLSGSPNLSSVAVGDVLNFNGGQFLIVDVDDVDKKLTVESTSITGSGAASIAAPSAVTYKETIVNNPSKRAAWYFNHIKVQRPSDSAIITVDPIGHVAGMIARVDSQITLGGVSRAPAGLGVGALADTVGLDIVDLSEKKDGGPLRLNFINRIISEPGAGINVMSAYVAESGTSPLFTEDERLLQVQRAILFIKESLEQGLRSFIWENFSPQTQARVEEAIKSFLRSNSYLFPAGKPESQQFRVISVTPTALEESQGLMKFRVQVTTNRGVRFIDIDLEFPIPEVTA